MNKGIYQNIDKIKWMPQNWRNDWTGCSTPTWHITQELKNKRLGIGGFCLFVFGIEGWGLNPHWATFPVTFKICYFEPESHKSLCFPGYAQTCDSPASTSQSAGIMSTHHYIWFGRIFIKYCDIWKVWENCIISLR